MRFVGRKVRPTGGGDGFEAVEARYGPDQDHDRSPYIVVGTRSR